MAATVEDRVTALEDQIMKLQEEKTADLAITDEIRNEIKETNEKMEKEKSGNDQKVKQLVEKYEEKIAKLAKEIKEVREKIDEDDDSDDRVPMGTGLSDDIERLRTSIEELQGRIKEVEGKSKGARSDEDSSPEGIKGFSLKNLPKPEPIDVHSHAPQEFNAWHDLFVVYSSTHDPKWEKILHAIDEVGKDHIDQSVLDRMKLELGLSLEGLRKAKQFLYLSLLQFTKGDSHSRVVAGGMDGSFESYRQLTVKGRNSTVTSLMDQRMKIMQPEKASKVEDVEMRITQWKADIRILRESRQRQDLEMLNNHDQMITILIGMLPDTLSDHLISKYTPEKSTFDEMLVEMQDHLMKVDQKKSARKSLKQVVPKKEEGEDSTEEEKGAWKHDEVYGWYLCTATPAAKRQRADDGGDEEQGKGNTKGKGKGDEGKGKGKSKGKGKGPVGGCHECGGDHFVRDCPIRAQRKGGQKGKGKSWDSVPTRQWSQWNPGFIPQQWGGWRPGNPNGQFGKGQFGKGGGKGVGQIAGKGADYSGGESFFDLNRLQFPALASVNYQAEEYPSSADMEWNGSPADGLPWVNVVTRKKKPKFEKVAGMAEEIHKAMSYTTSNRFGVLEEEAEDEVIVVGLEGPNRNHQKADKTITREKVRFCSRKIPCEEKCCATVPVRRMRQASSSSVDRVRIGTGSTESGVAESVPGTRVPVGTGQPGSESGGAGEGDRAEFVAFIKDEDVKMRQSGDTCTKGPGIAHVSAVGPEGPIWNRQGPLATDTQHSDGHPGISSGTDWRQDEKIVNRKLQFFRKHSPPKTIAPVEQKGKADGWTCLSMAVDSGACDNVVSPKDLPNYQNHIRETAESLKGEGFVSATGEDIPNFGEIILPVITRERQLKSITFQAAGVAKPLLSAEKLNKSGQLVIFDGDQSCIINKSTYEVMALRREEGNFMLDVWIPPAHVAEQMGFPGHP